MTGQLQRSFQQRTNRVRRPPDCVVAVAKPATSASVNRPLPTRKGKGAGPPAPPGRNETRTTARSPGRPIRLRQRLRDGADVAAHLRGRLSGLAVEECWAIPVGVRHRVILDTTLARGSLTGVEVHPRDVFRGAHQGRRGPERPRPFMCSGTQR